MSYLRLRQIALVARELEPTVEAICRVFGLAICYRDPEIERLGLENALIAVGPVFIEIVAPIRPNTTAERYLDRRNGDGGYMYIMDCDDVQRRRNYVQAKSIRIVAENKRSGWAPVESFQLHPKDTGGAILSIGTHAAGNDLYGGYYWAGPHWQAGIRTERTTAILGAEIQSSDPGRLAQRWADILERRLHPSLEAGLELRLDLGFARFVKDTDGRGEGLSAIHVKATDKPAIFAAARKEGLQVNGDAIALAGVRFVVS